MDEEEKLQSFLGAAGPDVDPDVARMLLEMHNWNLEAALNEVLAPPPQPHRDSVRSPMRTNFHDTLLPSGRGGSDDDLAYAMAQSLREQQQAQQAHMHQPGGAGGPDGQAPMSPSFFSQLSGALWGAITGSNDGRGSQMSEASRGADQDVPQRPDDEIPSEARHAKMPMETTARGSSPHNLNAAGAASSSQSKRIPESHPACIGSTSASASTPAGSSTQEAERKRAKKTMNDDDDDANNEEGEEEVLPSVRWSAAEATAAEDAWLTKLEEEQRRCAAEQARRRLSEGSAHPSVRQEEQAAASSSQQAPTPSPKKEKEGVKNEDKEKEAKALRCLQTLRKLEPKQREAVVKTLHAYISNLAKNPLDTRFHKINTENKNYMATIAPHAACLELLELCGFRRKGTFLIMDEAYMKSKGAFLWNVLAKVDVIRA